MSKSDIRSLLTRYWGHADFRPLQEEVILSVLDGRDTLALLPTGGGKSVCFQVPGLAMEGLTLVVSPLIALMKDQVERLRSKGIPAYAIVSGMSRREIDTALDNCIFGKVKFLYVSPERLSSETFLARFRQMKISLIAVDEAHCISQWGYDFRPSYLQVSAVRKELPGVPVLALTATATPEVREDIMRSLEFRTPNILKKSFERKNLAYVVLHTEDKKNRLLKVIRGVGGSGIVYVRSRGKTRELAEFLEANRIRASFYHAGLTMEERERVQQEWMTGKQQVMVATNAFGMGIDKPDVRFVVHLDLPDSPEAYFQEAGRAGRDEKKAYAVLMFAPGDRIELERRTEVEFPSQSEIRQSFTAVCNYLQIPVGSGKGASYDFDAAAVAGQYNLNPGIVSSSIRILQLQGLLAYSDAPGFHSRIRFTTDPERLYELQVRNPDLDRVIGVLLRSYEGLFNDYVMVREREIAKRCGLPLSETVALLQRLHRLQVLDYRPATDEPQLSFLEDRPDSKDLYIDREHLALRKERYVARAHAMLRYAEDKTHCRSMFLLSYFGESVLTRCGCCDTCLERNKADLNDLEFARAEELVFSMLEQQPCSLEEVLNRLRPLDQEHAIRVVEWLIDQGRIRYKGESLLERSDS